MVALVIGIAVSERRRGQGISEEEQNGKQMKRQAPLRAEKRKGVGRVSETVKAFGAS